MICDPELMRQVLVDDRTYDKGGVLAERGRAIVGNGPVTCGHAHHRRQRRVQPAFHRDSLPGYAETTAEPVAAVSGAW